MTSRTQYETVFSRVAQELGIKFDIAEWWYDSRNGKGFRITDSAHDCLTHFGIESYIFDINADLIRKPQLLLGLDRKITCPYYLGVKKPCRLVLFGSQDAVMLALYNDIELFLKGTRPRSSQ